MDDIPDDLKRKIRQSFASKSEPPKVVPRERINDLTQEVISSVGTSLLNEINPPKMNKEKLVSKETEGSSSAKSYVLEDSDLLWDGTISTGANMLEVSDMARSSGKQVNL
ncbi:hypothetical protein TNCT_22851 [Trichonephila clavata]|uniref:Uncharacterized protein n=1 Tax=Trichonephila clavata TaxID=2740835 RepID=A0A8X6FVL0_TRICU|nr:hypothetical protein TNCT_22851 [Trichonephila clavata]